MRFEPKAFDPKDRDGACTCTGGARAAHDPECPVRKAHPRLDLGDEPLEHTPLATRIDALRLRVGRVGRLVPAAGAGGAGASGVAAGGTGGTAGESSATSLRSS